MADTTAVSTAATSTSALNYIKSDTSKKTGGTNVNTDTFLKLLVAQMQYQDPLEPQSNTDFVSQLAMMTGLEQVQTMNGSLSTSKAMNYVGKQISATVLNSNTGVEEKYSGIVTGVVMKNGDAYAVVGDNAICVDDISSVLEAPQESGGTDAVSAAGTADTTAAGTGTAETAAGA